MARNVKLGNTTLSGVDAIKLNDADSVGTYDLFYCDDLFDIRTIIPTTSDQTITPTGNKVAMEEVVVKGIDGGSTFSASNIKAGVRISIKDTGQQTTILTALGTYTSDATATASDILSGKSAYVNGSKINGSMAIYDGSVS